MMCHSNQDNSGKSGRRKVSRLMIVGIALAIGFAVVVLVIYGVSWQVLALVAMIAVHPLMHLSGMHGKHGQQKEGEQQPVADDAGGKGQSSHH